MYRTAGELAIYLRNLCGGVLTQPVEHFLCGCGYKWISAE